MIKRPLLLRDLDHSTVIDNVIIESLAQALYRVVIEIDGEQYYILEKPSKALARHSVVAIQENFTPFMVRQMYLQHNSPYDEMIGLEVNSGGNTLLVPIGNYFDNVEKEWAEKSHVEKSTIQ